MTVDRRIKPGTPAASVANGGVPAPRIPRHKRKKRGSGGAAIKYGAVCNAKKSKGGRCNMAAGWGTNHPGIGCCRLHGGTAPNHVKAAAKEEYRILLGKPLEINPLDAILWCIKIRAGEVKWLGDRMAELDEKAWVEQTIVGKQFHLYAKERQHAMQDLARYSQMAISLNIAERAVKLAETYGEMLARLIHGILDDLDLSEEQRAKVHPIVRKHLIALDSGMTQEEEEMRAILPGAAA